MEHNDTSDSRAKIMEHYANPQFKGFKNQGEKYEAQSPTCSDRIQLEIASENDIVTHIAFEGEGCAVSLASSDTFCQKQIIKTKLKKKNKKIFFYKKKKKKK
jgi:nitrogen fixation NifU-like protein